MRFIIGVPLNRNNPGFIHAMIETAKQHLPDEAIIGFELGNEPTYWDCPGLVSPFGRTDFTVGRREQGQPSKFHTAGQPPWGSTERADTTIEQEVHEAWAKTVGDMNPPHPRAADCRTYKQPATLVDDVAMTIHANPVAACLPLMYQSFLLPLVCQLRNAYV